MENSYADSETLSLTKGMFDVLFDVIKNNPWVEPDPLKQLLFDDCYDSESREFVIDLINRFKYVDNNEFGQLIDDLAESITEIPSLTEQSTLVVAMAADRVPDSSQLVTYMMKSTFPKFSWLKPNIINRHDKAYDTFKKIKGCKNIVLVDEFVGTGSTAAGRVKRIVQSFKDAKVTDYNIYVRAIAASTVGETYLASKGIDFKALFSIKKGISEHYSQDHVPQKLSLMKELESILSPRYEHAELPQLGYGETEALYCRERGNTPNNVFPLFWWPMYMDGLDRETILVRAMGDA